MHIELPVNRLMDKIVSLVEWVTDGRWQIVPSERVDELYTETNGYYTLLQRENTAKSKTIEALISDQQQ